MQRIVEDLEDDDVLSDDVIEISNWASTLLGIDAENDYQWSRCLGRILRQYRLVDEAIKCYKKAISLTNDAWYAQLGLASAMADQGQYQEAIDIAEDLKNRLQKGVPQVEEPDASMGELRNSLAGWYREVERYDEALKIFDEGLVTNPHNYTLYKEKVLVFHKMGGYQKIFDMLEELSNAQDPNVGISKRNRFWHTMAFEDIFYNAMHEAAKQAGQIALLLSMMQQAVEEAANPNYIPLAAGYKLLWRVAINFYADEIRWSIVKSSEERQAVAEAWERNLQACIASNVDQLKPLIAKRLAQHYVDRLREIKDDSPEAQTTLKKLSDLTLDDTAQDDDTLKTSLLMARYESTRGNQDNAMKLTRVIVKVALDLLSDEDPENDWQGYWRLANVLMYYGDDENALAAWSLIGPAGSNESESESVGADGAEEITTGAPTTNGDTTKTEEPVAEIADRLAESTQEVVATDETKSEAGVSPDETIEEVVYAPSGALEWACDGDCDPTTSWTYANDIFVCKDCLDVAFDEKCLAKLRTEGLSENICNPKHEHLHVPKWDPKEAQDRGKDHVRLRGNKVRVAEWLGALRKQWGFEQLAKAEAAKDSEATKGTEQVNGASSGR